MTREELEARLEEVEDARFDLKMKDHWSSTDYRLDDKLFEERRALKEAIAKLA